MDDELDSFDIWAAVTSKGGSILTHQAGSEVTNSQSDVAGTKEFGLFCQANLSILPLKSNSIDMIFTDLPYPKRYLKLYGWLASEAARVLKPGGFVLAMAGEYWLPKIFQMFEAESRLSYFWRFTHLSNEAPYIWQRGVVAHAKSILAYAKEPGPHKPRMASVHGCYTGRKDKRFHHWGQDVDTARYYIDCFSAPGDLILDPCLGGGTTAVACEILGRRCLGFDIDRVTLITSTERLASSGKSAIYMLPLFSMAENGGSGQKKGEFDGTS